MYYVPLPLTSEVEEALAELAVCHIAYVVPAVYVGVVVCVCENSKLQAAPTMKSNDTQINAPPPPPPGPPPNAIAITPSYFICCLSLAHERILESNITLSIRGCHIATINPPQY